MWNKILRYLPCLRELPIKIKLILLILHRQYAHGYRQTHTYAHACESTHTSAHKHLITTSPITTADQACPNGLIKKKIKSQNKELYGKSKLRTLMAYVGQTLGNVYKNVF